MTKRAPIIWANPADAAAAADHIAAAIRQACARSGKARIAVPGGTTPVPIFALLAQRDLPWDQVSVCLTDDRIVALDHAASNQAKLVSALDGLGAEILVLENGARAAPFDLVWLGMGADGHIASLFPDMDADDVGGPAVIRTVPNPLPPEAPFARLTLNMAALTAAHEIMLVIRGEDKKQMLESALVGGGDLPISQLFSAASCPVTIFWSAS